MRAVARCRGLTPCARSFLPAVIASKRVVKDLATQMARLAAIVKVKRREASTRNNQMLQGRARMERDLTLLLSCQDGFSRGRTPGQSQNSSIHGRDRHRPQVLDLAARSTSTSRSSRFHSQQRQIVSDVTRVWIDCLSWFLY